jgi:hypothetical protein
MVWHWEQCSLARISNNRPPQTGQAGLWASGSFRSAAVDCGWFSERTAGCLSDDMQLTLFLSS